MVAAEASGRTLRSHPRLLRQNEARKCSRGRHIVVSVEASLFFSSLLPWTRRELSHLTIVLQHLTIVNFRPEKFWRPGIAIFGLARRSAGMNHLIANSGFGNVTHLTYLMYAVYRKYVLIARYISAELDVVNYFN